MEQIETSIPEKKDNPKRIFTKSRAFLCTWNNPGDDPRGELEKLHQKLQAVSTVGQYEMGEQGTPHLQFVIVFKNPRALSTFKGCKVYAEAAPRIDGAIKYCTKDETRIDGPWSFGQDVQVKKMTEPTDWELVRELAQQGKLQEIPANIYIRYYSNLSKIYKDSMSITDSGALRGVWIYGPSGIGKSRKARADFPLYYPKLANKWWDGYQQQRNVILDDIGLEHKCLGQQLKIWADRYGCVLEVKGGALPSSFDTLVVTSQYSIEQIWKDDEATIAALRRRFRVIHMTDPFQLNLEVSEETE